jgi:uncharacterized protein (DUF1501 family)
MDRRKFIHQMTHAAALPALFSSFPFESLGLGSASDLSQTIAEGNILVIIVLNGGNDGLNTVVPLNMLSKLNNIRSTVMLPDNKILPLEGTELGLHPALKGFQSLFKENRMKIVQAVAYPGPSYSHFRSMDIWDSASDSHKFENSGWAARYLEAKHPKFPEAYPTELFPHPLSMEIGGSSSLMFTGKKSFTSVVASNPEGFFEIINEFDNNYPSTPIGEKLKYLQLMAKQSNAYGKVLKEQYKKGTDYAFPRSNLADQLKIVSRLISGGLQTRIYKVQISGFDTHGAQVDTSDKTQGMHATLLKEIDEAVTAFMKSLDQMGKSDRVLGMCVSEFGRTVHSNGTYGTDHGTVSPVILFGNKVDPNVLGKNPIIPDNTNYSYEMDMQYDFRQVYASVMNQWMGGSKAFTQEVLFKEFAQIPIIQSAYIDSDEDGVPDVRDKCNDTPIGAIVDVNGCELFTLPFDNFKIEVLASTCVGANNGSLKISVQNTNYSYQLSVKGPNKYEKLVSIPKGVANSVLNGLTLGEYNLVFRVENVKNYQQAFDVKITEPAPLVVQSTIDAGNKSMSIQLGGSSIYQVQINDAYFKVTEPQWSTSLPAGLVKLQVSTDLSCQGVYIKEFFVSESVSVFPNPTTGPVQVHVQGTDSKVDISILNSAGLSLSNQTHAVPSNRLVALDLSDVFAGPYFIRVIGSTVDQTLKIIKL